PRLDPVPLAADTGAMSENEAALVPEQGWHCLHLFYRIEFSQWQLLSPGEQRTAKTALTSLVQEVRALESTQLLTLSIVTPKADLGFMLITPDWPVVCFYNMSKRRGETRNWYTLPYDERRRLMGGHAKVGREYAGKIKQLITGSSGLDDAEWGVTLFARDTFQIKAIVYEMRF